MSQILESQSASWISRNSILEPNTAEQHSQDSKLIKYDLHAVCDGDVLLRPHRGDCLHRLNTRLVVSSCLRDGAIILVPLLFGYVRLMVAIFVGSGRLRLLGNLSDLGLLLVEVEQAHLIQTGRHSVVERAPSGRLLIRKKKSEMKEEARR